ncbi:hypothetical protein [Alicyclobacillus fastidiosus]|uniref:hypothetical protein n=1 Tax=Alicyclobacillus fastidiosus TaxID=392011 RepID=UPI0034D6BBB3
MVSYGITKNDNQIIEKIIARSTGDETYFFRSTSLHVLPKSAFNLNHWIKQLLDDNTIFFTLFDSNNSETNVTSFISLSYQNAVASLSVICPNESYEPKLLNLAIQHSVEYAFKTQNMQRIYVYARDDGEVLKDVLCQNHFELEARFTEAYWNNDKFIDIDVFALLR